jgi:hypothetical protein
MLIGFLRHRSGAAEPHRRRVVEFPDCCHDQTVPSRTGTLGQIDTPLNDPDG